MNRTLYPNNLAFILELIDEFSVTTLGRQHLLDINDIIVDSLELIGKNESVYGLLGQVSFLRQRILKALPEDMTVMSARGTAFDSRFSPKIYFTGKPPKKHKFKLCVLSCIWGGLCSQTHS